MTKSILILGSSGRFGRHMGEQLRAQGYQVRGFDRTQDDLATAVAQSDIVVNGWNPKYQHWFRDVMPLTRNLISALKTHNRPLIMAGNVYGYGENPNAPWGPSSDQMAINPMGKLRIEMETAIRDAGIKTLILRSGDYLDTTASGNWFDSFIAPPAVKGHLSYPGNPNARHAWGFLPDVARAGAILVDMLHDLPQWTDLPIAGYGVTGHEMAGSVGRVLGRSVVAKPMSWTPIQIASPFWPLGRRLLEMRYLWSHDHVLDDAPLRQILPDFTMTPLDQALAQCAPLNEKTRA